MGKGRRASLRAACAALGVLIAASSVSAQDADTAAGADLNTGEVLLSDVPWNDRFTYGAGVQSGYFTWGDRGGSVFELDASERWSITLGIESDQDKVFDLDAVRAGAFFNFTPRLRFGGELTFTPEPDPALNLDIDEDREDAPEIKLESAFRF